MQYRQANEWPAFGHACNNSFVSTTTTTRATIFHETK